MLPVGSPNVNWSQVRGQTNCGSKYHKSSSQLAAFLEVLTGALQGAPVGDSVVLLRDFNVYVSSDGDTWRGMIGMNGLADLNPSGALDLKLSKEFCSVKKCANY